MEQDQTLTPEQRAKQIMGEALGGMEAPDPVDLEALAKRLKDLDLAAMAVLSPNGMQNAFNTLSRCLSECQGIVSNLQTRLTFAKKRGRTMRMATQLAKRFLFKEDPEVRAGRSLTDREAIAACKLCKELIELQQAEMALANFETALMMAQDRLRYLKDRRATLRDQKDLLEAEIYISGSGSRGGSGFSRDLRPTGPYGQDPDAVLAQVIDPDGAPVSPDPDEIRRVRAKSSVSG